MRKTEDGRGEPIDPSALYFIQDTRQVVGNCALWWRPKGAGYTCDLNDAGLYTGAEIVADRERETDVPWPAQYVRENAVTHVRADTRVLRRPARAGESR